MPPAGFEPEIPRTFGGAGRWASPWSGPLALVPEAVVAFSDLLGTSVAGPSGSGSLDSTARDRLGAR